MWRIMRLADESTLGLLRFSHFQFCRVAFLFIVHVLYIWCCWHKPILGIKTRNNGLMME
jgi:ABC-type glucose/galactose transport system permease subunit